METWFYKYFEPESNTVLVGSVVTVPKFQYSAPIQWKSTVLCTDFGKLFQVVPQVIKYENSKQVSPKFNLFK